MSDVTQGVCFTYFYELKIRRLRQLLVFVSFRNCDLPRVRDRTPHSSVIADQTFRLKTTKVKTPDQCFILEESHIQGIVHSSCGGFTTFWSAMLQKKVYKMTTEITWVYRKVCHRHLGKWRTGKLVLVYSHAMISSQPTTQTTNCLCPKRDTV